LLENAITPIQQYSYTTGKNATDSAMIIDAMDILYSEKVDAFCIVSSDSDFTRLATRLREAGMTVIGLGEKKTPNPFIVACDKFIYIEILNVHAEESIAKVDSIKGKKEIRAPQAETLQKIGRETINLISTSIRDLADDSGWAFLGEVGSLILKKQPDFDPRNFGFGKLALLIKSISKFEVDERETEKKSSKLVCKGEGVIAQVFRLANLKISCSDRHLIFDSQFFFHLQTLKAKFVNRLSSFLVDDFNFYEGLIVIHFIEMDFYVAEVKYFSFFLDGTDFCEIFIKFGNFFQRWVQIITIDDCLFQSLCLDTLVVSDQIFDGALSPF